MAKGSLFRRLIYVLILLALIGAGLVLWGPWRVTSALDIPRGEVRLGEFVEYVQIRGEVRARSSNYINAPFNAGDLQILRLCKDGTPVQKGDVVVEFDPSSLQRSVDQYRTTLKQLDAQIARLKAQQLLRDEQSLTDKMMAAFGVERARLDASKGEVVPAVENEKNLMTLGKAEMKAREVEQQMTSNRIGAEADLAGILRKREKANLDLEQAQQRMKALRLVSPVDGLLMLQPNSRARAAGTSMTPIFKEGDRAYAGAAIAEIPDLSTLMLSANVDEADRGRLEKDQAVTLKIDAVPDKEFRGRIGAISALARLDFSSASRRFDATILLEQTDPRLRPGMSATARVAVLRLPDSVLIPLEAVFEKNARAVAYVLVKNRFEERSITVGRRGEGTALIARGLKLGERVALKDPTLVTEPRSGN
jgi:HlyD family secretion protein